MYKAQFHIYVIWHPKYKEGEKIANAMYSNFTRNIEEPLSRGIGIPVFFRSESKEKESPIKINFNEAERNAVIFLVDTHAINNWKNYAKSLHEDINKSENDRTEFFPVSMSADFRNIGKTISESNFIRLHETDSYKKKLEKLLFESTHEFCRMLYDKPRFSEIEEKKYSNEPVTLFISHSKRDGLEIAEQIKAKADSDSTMNTFFDAIDIAPGHKFESELDSNIESSALLVIQTDSYASREWCRWEVLKAKKANRPVIVVNAIKKGEERSFPYLGNVPTIRWSTQRKNIIESILSFTLYEVLRFIYTYEYINSLKGIKRLAGTTKPKILSSPPELLTLLEKATESETGGKIVIYPDPPLTAEELELLMDTTSEFEFLTPTFLPAYTSIRNEAK